MDKYGEPFLLESTPFRGDIAGNVVDISYV
jgi:hypothetical protein